MLVIYSWFSLLLLVYPLYGDIARQKPRLSLEESHLSFDVRRQRSYDLRSNKIRQQERKVENAQKRLDSLNFELGQGGTRFCNISQPLPDALLSYVKFDGEPVAVTMPERNGNARCSFLGAVCSTENPEHQLVSDYIKGTDVVLELGARYGTTSCAIAKQQRNSGKLVSVEPDNRVWNLLDENRRTHRCSFWLLRGVVADKPAAISGMFYSTRATASNSTRTHAVPTVPDRCRHSSERPMTVKRHYTYSEIQNSTGLRFSALLIDCEGCIETLFAGNSAPLPELLRDVRTIVLEADMAVGAADCTHDCVNYLKWVEAFKTAGLHVVRKAQDPVFPKIQHYVFQRT